MEEPCASCPRQKEGGLRDEPVEEVPHDDSCEMDAENLAVAVRLGCCILVVEHLYYWKNEAAEGPLLGAVVRALNNADGNDMSSLKDVVNYLDASIDCHAARAEAVRDDVVPRVEEQSFHWTHDVRSSDVAKILREEAHLRNLGDS